jgi:hypothetical protein
VRIETKLGLTNEQPSQEAPFANMHGRGQIQQFTLELERKFGISGGGFRFQPLAWFVFAIK